MGVSVYVCVYVCMSAHTCRTQTSQTHGVQYEFSANCLQSMFLLFSIREMSRILISLQQKSVEPHLVKLEIYGGVFTGDSQRVHLSVRLHLCV